jgi:monofunctional biosynthetic peptidoglycan transglycosylase
MSLRILTRLVLIVMAALAVMAVVGAAHRAISPALAVAGSVALFVCASTAIVATIRWIRPTTSARMIVTRAALRRRDGNHEPIAFEWAGIEDVSREMWLAAIAAEDAYFRHHSGFDWQSLQEAHAHNQTHDRKRGGSTITQQVAKNLFLWHGRSYVRKAIEAYVTLLIEASWPKRRILEVYLNVAQLGEDVFGVQAAARRYFDKPARDLTQTEAALLAAALPNPMRFRVSEPSHEVRFRQAWILGAMRRMGDVYLERL